MFVSAGLRPLALRGRILNPLMGRRSLASETLSRDGTAENCLASPRKQTVAPESGADWRKPVRGSEQTRHS